MFYSRFAKAICNGSIKTAQLTATTVMSAALGNLFYHTNESIYKKGLTLFPDTQRMEPVLKIETDRDFKP